MHENFNIVVCSTKRSAQFPFEIPAYFCSDEAQTQVRTREALASFSVKDLVTEMKTSFQINSLVPDKSDQERRILFWFRSFIAVADLTSKSSAEESDVLFARKRFIMISTLDIGIKLFSAIASYLSTPTIVPCAVGRMVEVFGFEGVVYYLLGNSLLLGLFIWLMPETNHNKGAFSEQRSLQSIRTALVKAKQGFTKEIILAIFILFFVMVTESDSVVDALYLQNAPILWHSYGVGVFA
ncbi:hypothetical protein Ciccas_010204 [Cichlidogyrus casuarinus]|uniref:Uncharacterized protein n=1 Tax=Cichlidogyrus casuarinus TaxID=1844966 RepID=A0ABD2PUU2_9PLAT